MTRNEHKYEEDATEAQKYNPNPNYYMICLVTVSNSYTVILESAQWVEKTNPNPKASKVIIQIAITGHMHVYRSHKRKAIRLPPHQSCYS